MQASALVALTLQEKANALQLRIGWGSSRDPGLKETLLLISALPASQLLVPQVTISCSISWGVYKAGTLGLCVQQKEKPIIPQLFSTGLVCFFLIIVAFSNITL